MKAHWRRLNEGLWQPVERPLLQWFAFHLPAWVTPDGLTAMGLAGAAVGFFGYAFSGWHREFLWLASVGLIINWFGDSLDGTLARARKIERPRYGFLIDHTTDTFAEVLFAFGLGLTPNVRFEVACIGLIAYLLMAVYTFVRANVLGTLQIAFNGIGPTEVRVAMIILNIWMFFAPPGPMVVLWAPLSPIDIIILASAASVLLFLVFAIRRDAHQLALEDPAPTADPQ